MTLKKIIILIFTCSGCYYAGYFVAAPNTDSAITPNTAPISSKIANANNFTADATANLLEEENLQLKKKIEILQKQILIKKIDTNKKTTLNVNQETNTSNEQVYKNLKKSDEFVKYIEDLSKKNISLHQGMNEKFIAENIDAELAYQQEEKLGELFAKHPELAEIKTENIQCKTHICRISIRINDPNHANNIASEFTDALQENTLNIAKSSVIATHDFAQGLAYLYINKQDQ